jgi:hypothetical protein
LALLAGLAAAIALSAALAGAQTVTLTVLRTFDQPTRLYKLKFSGTISSGAAGEDVTVMQQTCGYSFATAVAGAQSRSGGFWDAESNTGFMALSATYRARWKNELSEPVAIRPQIPVFFFPIPKGRFVARVTIGSVSQDMRKKIVLLQRFRNEKWATIQRARLVADGAGGAGFAYAATFKLPQRGWTLRAKVPAKTAAPCFKTNATEKLRS